MIRRITKAALAATAWMVGASSCSLLGPLGSSQCEVSADCQGVDDLPAGAYVCEEGVCVDRPLGETTCERNADCLDAFGGLPSMCVDRLCRNLTVGDQSCEPIGFDAEQDDYVVLPVLSPRRLDFQNFGSRSTVEHVLEQIGRGSNEQEPGRIMVLLCDGSTPQKASALVPFLVESLKANLIITEQRASDVAATFSDVAVPVLTTRGAHPTLEASPRGPDLFHEVGHPADVAPAFGAALTELLEHLEANIFSGGFPDDFNVVLLRPSSDQEPAGEEVRDALAAALAAKGLMADQLLDLPSEPFPYNLLTVPAATVTAGNAAPDVVVSLHGASFALSMTHLENLIPPLRPHYILDHGGRSIELLSDVPALYEMVGLPRRVIGVEHGVIPSRYEDYAERIFARGFEVYPFARDGLHDAIFKAALVYRRMLRRGDVLDDAILLRSTLDQLDDGDEVVRVFDANSFAAAAQAFDGDEPTLHFSGTRGDLNWSEDGVPSWPARAYCPSRPEDNPTTALRMGLAFSDLASSCW